MTAKYVMACGLGFGVGLLIWMAMHKPAINVITVLQITDSVIVVSGDY
jgi:hypothetical protein